MPFQIGFLGAGKMATALAGGFLRAGLVRPDEVIASDPHPAARDAFAAATGAAVTDDNAAVAAAPDLIVAVKPDQVAAVRKGDHRRSWLRESQTARGVCRLLVVVLVLAPHTPPPLQHLCLSAVVTVTECAPPTHDQTLKWTE
ncbi:MAG: pyrroline-5-carboxylate reductase family protein, partial [Limisphaerales bacterium]